MQFHTNKVELIHACMLCASVEKSRYYLHGVCIQPHVEGGLTFVSTNGEICSIGYDPDAFFEDIPESGIILQFPKDITKNMKASANIGTLTWKDGKLQLGKQIFEDITPIDGFFPDWKGIIPSKDTVFEKSILMSPKYLKIVVKISKIINADTRHVNPVWISSESFDSPAIIKFPKYEHWRGIFMGMRDHKPEVQYIPDWLK